MTAALFLLRCVEIGINISELDLLTIGMVLDIWTEKSNDGVKYSKVAGQTEFDKFQHKVVEQTPLICYTLPKVFEQTPQEGGAIMRVQFTVNDEERLKLESLAKKNGSPEISSYSKDKS